jgi:hypothetical protein
VGSLAPSRVPRRCSGAGPPRDREIEVERRGGVARGRWSRTPPHLPRRGRVEPRVCSGVGPSCRRRWRSHGARAAGRAGPRARHGAHLLRLGSARCDAMAQRRDASSTSPRSLSIPAMRRPNTASFFDSTSARCLTHVVSPSPLIDRTRLLPPHSAARSNGPATRRPSPPPRRSWCSHPHLPRDSRPPSWRRDGEASGGRSWGRAVPTQETCFFFSSSVLQD